MIFKQSFVSLCIVAGLSVSAAVSAAEPGVISDEAEARIEALRARPDMTAAFETIEAMRERNNERLIALTEIAAPPFEEDARAADLARRLEALGLEDVSIDDAGNVIARRPGTDGSRMVAIAAHIDTVFPAETDVTVRREGDVFYAPGIGDNTRGVVALLALVEAMQTMRSKRRPIFSSLAMWARRGSATCAASVIFSARADRRSTASSPSTAATPPGW